VQGLVLGFAQLYNTLHRVLRRNGSAEVNKIQTRLPATLMNAAFHKEMGSFGCSARITMG
jgi:hypothetical protein